MTEAAYFAERTDVAAEVRAWIGTPYRHQASLKGAGTDCLGLVRGVFRALYGHEPEAPPPYAPDWAEAAGTETLRDAARRHLVEVGLEDIVPGDVLLFRMMRNGPAKHCAILVAPDRMVHAYSGYSVREEVLGDAWRRRLAYGFRFPPLM
jgi:NlpC/P60 family putative phage cell wall peptidase